MEKGVLKNSIYEVTTVSELEDLYEILCNDREFMDKNKRGNNMYTAGLNNYISFAKGELFSGLHSDIAKLDFKAVSIKKTSVVEKHQRDRIVVRQVMESCDYHCELDVSHETFITEATKLPYLEGHHIISLSQQMYFNYSLDVYANILGVCPTCHRMLHYG